MRWAGAIHILAVLAVVLQRVDAAQCSTIEVDTDYYSNDIKSTQQTSADKCCDDCAKTTGCTVYVWNNYTQTCWLKSQPSNKATAPGARASRLVLTPATCSAVQKNIDLPGNDIGDPIQADTYALCCTYCSVTKGCVAYAWSPADASGPATCYLKSSKGKATAYKGSMAAYWTPPTTAPTTKAPTTTKATTAAPTTTKATTAAPTTTAATTAAPTTSAATTTAPTTTKATTAAPTTAAPTPSPTTATQCAAVQPNTDYYGNDMVTLEKDTIDQCCTACISTPGCVVFVWVMRDVGTCLLKSGMGSPSTFTGAYASYPIVPTPAPTPSACPVVEANVDYPNNDIFQTYRTNYQDCCTDCQATPGCSLYVWSRGTCFLKSKKGPSSYASGAKAGVLPVTAPVTALANLQFGVHGAFPLPPLSYGYIPGSMWIDQTTLPAINSQVEAFLEKNKAANNSHEAPPVPILTLEADMGLTLYLDVTSKGECAALTAAYGNNFFTYLPSQFYCLSHLNTADTTLQVFTAPGQTMVFPQSLDDAYISSSQTNVATNALCLSACATKNNCVGVVYTTSTKLCTFYQPKVSTIADVSAGWVNPAAYYVDNGSIQYTKMPMASLPKAYVSSTMPSVTSVDACATYANTKSSILFGYNSNTLSCDVYTPTSSTTKSLSFFNTPSAPVVLSGAFGSDVSGGSLTASTSLDCYKLCLPSQNNCFASVFDSTAKTCASYQASFDVSSTLGWIIPKTLPTTMSTVNQVDFFITAHQDDHELFMSVPVYNSLKSSTTKAVFVYMSGGDAGQTDGWWQAREFGTLAATKGWVNMFGVYSPVPKNDTVVLNSHHVNKITIGNAIHYFLRLSETNLGYVLNENKTKAPLDQPSEYYANAQAVKDMLKAILVAEASMVAKVTASYSEYITDPQDDHVLHVATGRISAELLNSDPLFSSCVSQTTYFGYQHWLDAVNMKDPESSAQRSIWLNLVVGIYSHYDWQVWSGHSGALGRSYTGRSSVKSSACNF